MTDDPAGPVIDPPGSSRAEQPPPYQWIVRAASTAWCRACEAAPANRRGTDQLTGRGCSRSSWRCSKRYGATIRIATF